MASDNLSRLSHFVSLRPLKFPVKILSFQTGSDASVPCLDLDLPPGGHSIHGPFSSKEFFERLCKLPLTLLRVSVTGLSA